MIRDKFKHFEKGLYIGSSVVFIAIILSVILETIFNIKLYTLIHNGTHSMWPIIMLIFGLICGGINYFIHSVRGDI